MSKRALGKGIDALLAGDLDERTVNEETSGIGATLVPIAKIDTGAGQPRKEFRAESLAELAESIRQQGILQPILVEREGERFSIVAGERRFRAATLAGLSEVPVIVRALNREQKLEIALIENIQREDLTPIEEAEAYRSLMGALELSQEELANKIGKKRSTVANSLRLLNLPPDMQQAVSGGDITAGHARAILSAQNPADQRVLFKRIIDRGLSVREAEAQSESMNKGSRGASTKSKPKARAASPDLAEIERRFIDVLGTKVSLKGTMGKGKIEISYFSSDDLDRIYQIIDRQRD